MLTMLKKFIPTARTILGILSITLLLAAVAFGQTSATSLAVNYFTNNQAVVGATIVPDSQMHIINPGSTGGFGNRIETNTSTPAGGDLCANIYVFDPAEELVECCSCLISPNGLMGFSVATMLTQNPITGTVTGPAGGIPRAGDIKITSSFGANPTWASAPTPPTVGVTADGQPCDSSTPGNPFGLTAAGTLYTPVGNLEAWITHARPTLPGGGTQPTVTEVDFLNAYLSQSELNKLQSRCAGLIGPEGTGGLGSGNGKCACGTLF